MKENIQRRFIHKLTRDFDTENPADLKDIDLRIVQPVYDVLTPEIRSEQLIEHVPTLGTSPQNIPVVRQQQDHNVVGPSHVLIVQQVEWWRPLSIQIRWDHNNAAGTGTDVACRVNKAVNHDGFTRHYQLYTTPTETLAPGGNLTQVLHFEPQIKFPSWRHFGFVATTTDRKLVHYDLHFAADPADGDVEAFFILDYDYQIRSSKQQFERPITDDF